MTNKEWLNSLSSEDFAEWCCGADIIDYSTGKPNISIEDFQTSNDIIEWYYNISNLYRQICEADYNSLKEMLKND